MASAISKDFKVKNGLIVAGNGAFAGTVAVATPTLPGHAATKEYVDANAGGGSDSSIYVGNTEPVSPTNGSQWFDITVKRLKIFYDNEWFVIATSDDAISVTEHKHDPVTGFISGFYISGGEPSEPDLSIIDGGSPYTTAWYQVLDAGFVETLFDSGNPENDSLEFADGMAPETQTWNYVLDGNGV